MVVFVYQFYILQVLMKQINKYHLKFEVKSKEREDEKWRPIISVEAILLSVQNMLSDPNENSPANIDAAVTFVTNHLNCRDNGNLIRKHSENV